jgi:hypothetical protein
LITRVESTLENEKSARRVSDNPSGAENVYGNQNCNEATVSQKFGDLAPSPNSAIFRPAEVSPAGP